MAILHAPITGPADPRIWLSMAASALMLAFVFRASEDVRLTLFSRSGPTSRLMLRLLTAAAVVPLAGELAASLGSGLGLYTQGAAAAAHVVIVTVAFLFIVVEVAGTIQRIDAQRLAALLDARRSEARMRLQIERMPIACITAAPDLTITSWNPAARRTFGWAEEEVIGRSAKILMPFTDDAELTERMHRVIAGDSTAHGINQNVTKDGRTIVCRWSNTPLVDDDGTVTGIIGMAEDITEEIVAQDKLRNAQAAADLLLSAVEQLDEVMFTTDRQGTITYVNPAFERVYGYSREEAIGKTPRILRSGELPREQYRWMWSELLDGRSVRINYRNRKKDGRLVDVTATASPMFDATGSIIGFIAVQQDVTEHKRAVEERRAIDDRLGRLARIESLGTLAGGIAHDFNNILAIILTHTTLIERKKDDPAAVTRGAATVKQAVQRGAALSKQVLTFARRADLNPQNVRVGTVILELGSMLSETFPRNIQFSFDFDPDLPPICADSGQLHQALLNLCLNARDAMPNGGNISIEAQQVSGASIVDLFQDAPATDCVAITVRDSGAGMDADTRKRIFEPFFTTKEKGKGTGLGLAVVYGVVKSHHGAIDVESAPGRGTTFRLYFPAAQECPDNAPPLDAVKPIGGNESLLIIEDEPAILHGISEQLHAAGYELHTARDGEEAVAVCRRAARPPAAILMDLGMPKVSAGVLVKTLLDVAPRTAIVAMTGYVDTEIHERITAAGVQRVIQKPFEMDELLRALRQAIDGRP